MEDITLLGNLLPRFLTEILAAIVCGGLIGLERGRRGEAIGLRDNILICVGVVLYMITAELIGINQGGGDSNQYLQNGSSCLIVASIVIGIALLGSGILIRGIPEGRRRGENRNSSSGLSGSGTVWVVGAIGIIIGIGNWLLALLVTGATLLILTMLSGIEKHLERKPRSLLLKLIVREDNPDIRSKLQELLERYGVKAESFRSERGPFGVRMTLQASEEPENIRELITELWTVQGITEVEH